MAVRGRGSYRDCFLEVFYSSFPASDLTTYHPASCAVAILSKSRTTRVRSTKMLKTTEKMKIRLGVHGSFFEVLLPIFAQPFEVLANFRIEFDIQSLSIFRWNEFVQYSFLFAIAVGPRLSLISLHGILVFLSTACLADFPLFHVYQIAITASLFIKRFVRDVNLYDVVVISYKRIVPTSDFLGFPFSQIVSSSIPNIRKKIQSFFLVAARSASFAL